MSTMLASVMMLAAAEANTAPQVACDLGKARSQGGANEVCGSSRPPLQLRVWPRAKLLLFHWHSLTSAAMRSKATTAP